MRYIYVVHFITDELTKQDMVEYGKTTPDKVNEDDRVVKQLKNIPVEPPMLGDYPKTVNDTVMNNSDANNNQMMRLLSEPAKPKGFATLVHDILRLVE